MAISGLTEGRNVHYVMTAAPSRGKHRPAIISEVEDQEKGIVSLSVFITRADGFPGPVLQREHIEYSEEKTEGTWHFIEPTP